MGPFLRGFAEELVKVAFTNNTAAPPAPPARSSGPPIGPTSAPIGPTSAPLASIKPQAFRAPAAGSAPAPWRPSPQRPYEGPSGPVTPEAPAPKKPKAGGGGRPKLREIDWSTPKSPETLAALSRKPAVTSTPEDLAREKANRAKITEAMRSEPAESGWTAGKRLTRSVLGGVKDVAEKYTPLGPAGQYMGEAAGAVANQFRSGGVFEAIDGDSLLARYQAKQTADANAANLKRLQPTGMSAPRQADFAGAHTVE